MDKRREKEKRPRVRREDGLRRLSRKMTGQFFRLVAETYVIATMAKALLVDGVLEDPFANFFVAAVRVLLGLSKEEGIRVYQGAFLRHKGFWMTLMVLIIFLFFWRRLLRRFSQYFRQLDSRLDQLLTETAQPREELPPELAFMEEKLERIQAALAARRQAALESEQRKNDLVVYLAHDLKTPLTSVVGYLSLLNEAPDMPLEQRGKYTQVALDKAYRLEELINQFFDITRFNLQQVVLERRPVRLDVTLAQIADEFYPILAQQGQWAQVEAEPGLTVSADPDKLARVFNNLFKNAAAYGYENTAIQARAQRQEDQVVISVRNQGPRIPPRQLELIFEKFYRMDAARSTNAGGAGLGLAIAKQIVELHGGSISAQSDNQFTVFTVFLPLEDPDPPEPLSYDL